MSPRKASREGCEAHPRCRATGATVTCPGQGTRGWQRSLLLAQCFVQVALDGVQEVCGVQEVLVQLHIAQAMDAAR